jgi:F-type H+-transporting ATPase subunit b
MQEIVHQLGELFLQAVPTVLILLVFYLVLRSLFFKPLLQVMAEREARTTGARKAAEAAQAAAAEKAKQYQEALRQARAKIYAEQEAERKTLLDQRAALLKEERSKAAAEVARAKQRIAAELSAARKEIESTVAQLSAEIARRVLQPAGPPRPTNPAPTSPREAQ